MIIFGSARHDENGKYTNGSISKQDPSEVSQQPFYNHSKGWVVLRCKDYSKAKMIAEAMKMACESVHGGYDQNNRLDLYQKAKKHNFDISHVSENWETDCSALVRVCLAYAGINVGDFYTGNEKDVLLASGMFVEVVFVSESQLRKGDILVTRTKGHTVIVIDDGRKEYSVGWHQDEKGWWYAFSVSEYYHNEWAVINGCKYYFNSEGYAVTGLQTIKGKRYFFENTKGAPKECALMITDDNNALVLWS